MAQSASTGARSATREKRRRSAIIVWRWTLVLLGATGASWLVYGAIEQGAWLPVQLPTTGIAIATAGAFAGDLMALFISCGQFVRGERHVTLSSLVPSFWKAWGTLTAVFIALLSYVMPMQVTGEYRPQPVAVAEPPPAPPPVETSTPPWFVVYSTQPPPPAVPPRLSTIPVFFRNNAAPETARVTKSRLVPGVSFAPEELDVSIEGLKRILAALSACGTVPGGPATELEIAGYASSKEFTGPAGSAQEDSDLRNAQIANRRARAAYCFVDSQAPVVLANEAEWSGYEDGPECTLEKSQSYKAETTPLKVTVRRWPESADGFLQMAAARKFVDRPPGVAQATYNDPEELNRRVDIHVISAGACSVSAPESAPLPAPTSVQTPTSVQMPMSDTPAAEPRPDVVPPTLATAANASQ